MPHVHQVVHYCEMMHHGKNHRQAMGAVMSYLGARVLMVLKEGRPYELRDIEGNPISKEHARKLILAKYRVPEKIRRGRRRRNRKVSKNRETATYRTHKAAKASQPVLVQAVCPKQV